MKNLIMLVVFCGLIMGLYAACGDSGNGTVFKPSKPVFNPQSGGNNPYVPGESGVCVSINSDNQIRVMERVDNEPDDPNCQGLGAVYSGTFRVGGPNETVYIKAITCNQNLGSEIAEGVYTFGPCSGGTGCDTGVSYSGFCD